MTVRRVDIESGQIHERGAHCAGTHHRLRAELRVGVELREVAQEVVARRWSPLLDRCEGRRESVEVLEVDAVCKTIWRNSFSVI